MPRTKSLIPLLIMLTLSFAIVGCSASGTANQSTATLPDNQVGIIFANKHTLQGAFVPFFYQNGGHDTFGMAITREFFSPEINSYVQCFEAVCLSRTIVDGQELVTPVPINVLLGRMVAQEPPAAGDCMYVESSGHNVCYEFKRVWLEHSNLLGDPISGHYQASTRIIQDFENASLEFHFNNSNGWVLWMDQGFVWAFDQPAWGQISLPVMGAAPVPYLVTSLQTRMFVNPTTILSSSDHRVNLTVLVSDQNNEAVEGAAIHIQVRYPNGAVDQFLPTTRTDSAGQFDFQLALKPANNYDEISVDVTAYSDNLQQSASQTVYYFDNTAP